ncbi:hypothetical protein VP01_609g3 [Puccinia sorghi]|uniref:Uncharacterized protein n=1 Tax=Puccinia sorghi TaxID=27349 RepID=A0A0L6UJ81_9BASI|nr:hypothetical protein VP01_609g3 [Puccinia sorghi]
MMSMYFMDVFMGGVLFELSLKRSCLQKFPYIFIGRVIKEEKVGNLCHLQHLCNVGELQIGFQKYFLIFYLCTLVFLSLVIQAPLFCGLAQVTKFLAESSNGQPTYFESKHSQIKYKSFLSFSVPCLYYLASKATSSLYSLWYLQCFHSSKVVLNDTISSNDLPRPSTLSILAACSSSLVFQGYIPVAQFLTGWTSFLISVSTALHTQCNLKHPQSGSQYLTGLLHACTHSVKQTHLRPLKERYPSHPLLIPTKTSQMMIPIQPSSPRNLVAVKFLGFLSMVELQNANLMLRPSHFKQAPGKRGWRIMKKGLVLSRRGYMCLIKESGDQAQRASLSRLNTWYQLVVFNRLIWQLENKRASLSRLNTWYQLVVCNRLIWQLENKRFLTCKE